MTEIIVLAHNIRSAHNIGSLFRTADGFGVQKIIISGYSPYPTMPDDERLPHIREKITKDIHKTALGAENTVPFRRIDEPPLHELKAQGYHILALEQSTKSTYIHDYSPPKKIALLLGEEVSGITADLLNRCDDIVEIPMKGTKESFNVSVAAAIALYQLSIIDYNKS